MRIRGFGAVAVCLVVLACGQIGGGCTTPTSGENTGLRDTWLLVSAVGRSTMQCWTHELVFEKGGVVRIRALAGPAYSDIASYTVSKGEIAVDFTQMSPYSDCTGTLNGDTLVLVAHPDGFLLTLTYQRQ